MSSQENHLNTTLSNEDNSISPNVNADNESDTDIAIFKEEEEEENLDERSRKKPEVPDFSVDITLESRTSKTISDFENYLNVDITSYHLEPLATRTSVQSKNVMSVIKMKDSKYELKLASYKTIYDVISQEYEEEKELNSYLHTKLCQYYVRNKKFHVIHEGKITIDKKKKYNKELDNFEALKEKYKLDRDRVQAEKVHLEEKRVAIQHNVQELFQKFQQTEEEAGREILAHENEDTAASRHKIIDGCLKRQKNQLSNIIKMRLQYIKLRNRMSNIQEQLNAIDNLGPNLYLADYEQLKINNRNLRDKLDEKETELITVRKKCQETSQILAHVRERCHSIDSEIVRLERRFNNVQQNYDDVRQTLNFLKYEKDEMRLAINKIKTESGLITYPTLLQDMQSTENELQSLITTIQKYIKDFNAIETKIKVMKEIINKPLELLHKIIHRMETEKQALSKDSLYQELVKTKDSVFSLL